MSQVALFHLIITFMFNIILYIFIQMNIEILLQFTNIAKTKRLL